MKENRISYKELATSLNISVIALQKKVYGTRGFKDTEIAQLLKTFNCGFFDLYKEV